MHYHSIVFLKKLHFIVRGTFYIRNAEEFFIFEMQKNLNIRKAEEFFILEMHIKIIY